MYTRLEAYQNTVGIMSFLKDLYLMQKLMSTNKTEEN